MIPKSLRNGKLSKNPGPGHYNPSTSLTETRYPTTQIRLDEIDKLANLTTQHMKIKAQYATQ